MVTARTPSNQHSGPEAFPGPALMTRTRHLQAPLVCLEKEIPGTMSRGIARSEDPPDKQASSRRDPELGHRFCNGSFFRSRSPSTEIRSPKETAQLSSLRGTANPSED